MAQARFSIATGPAQEEQICDAELFVPSAQNLLYRYSEGFILNQKYLIP